MLKVHQLVIIGHIRILLQGKIPIIGILVHFCVFVCCRSVLWYVRHLHSGSAKMFIDLASVVIEYSSTTFNSHTIGTNFQKQLVLLNYSELSLKIFARCVTSLVLYFFGHLQFSSYITFAVWSNGSPWWWLFVLIQYMTCLLVCSLIKWTIHLT